MDTGETSSGSPNVSASLSLPSNAPVERTAKLLVTIDEAGRPYGPNSDRLASRTGDFVRLHCPIKYTDWRIVPQNCKDDVWNSIMSEFEFNVPSHLVRPCLEANFPQKLRTFKYKLRSEILKNKATKEAALEARPADCSPDNWKGFVENEFKEGVKEKNAKYAEVAKRNPIPHTLGRCSYANKCYNLEKEQGIVLDGRPELWMKGHERKDGVVHPSAIKKYEEVKAAHEKRKRMGEDGPSSQLDFDNDALTDVFGKDKGKGGVLGFSSHISRKRVMQANLASCVSAAKVDGSCDSNDPILATVYDLTTRVENLAEIMLKNMGSHQSTQAPISSSAHIPINHPSSNFGLTSSTSGDENMDSSKESVNLLDRERNIVATGYIVNGKEGEVCHGRKVYPGEKKVRIEVVKNPTAAVPDPPQGEGHYTLAGYVEGGWVVWAESRLSQRKVNLLDRERNIVATGYIVNGKEGEVCHGRKVYPGERKVCIEVVKDPTASVPDPPQGDGHYTLEGYVEGGSIIWSESRLSYEG
ncbi:hypothetical protein C5167_030204 [Papaver somniferum]|uniref:uncharacterized protein LOC113329431 n=1 Tax=Papaver somniferum TaxID=3469 RepID=UPI000E6F9A19|nr:uncharacterized protein LOC113329431 [Papaver somniferum]RZC86856.1 hypothetical protein C5167_030204 [Papaver somniferum]